MVEMDMLNTYARVSLDDLEVGVEANVTLSVPLDIVTRLVEFDQFSIGNCICIDPQEEELLISFTLRNEEALAGQIQLA